MISARGRLPLVGLVLGLAVLAGCSKQQEQSQDVSTLPYLQHTHHPQLRDEYDRLKAEQGLPQQLGDADAGGMTVQQRAKKQADELNELCPLQNVRLALKSIELFYPQDSFSFDPITLQKVRMTIERHSTHLMAYRKLMQRPDFAFYISVGDGLMADLSVLDHAELAHRLEAMIAADTLAAGEITVTLSTLRNMLRIDSRLAQLPSVAARSTAAMLRGEALQVAAARSASALRQGATRKADDDARAADHAVVGRLHGMDR